MTARLHLVEPAEPDPATELARLVPELLRTERTAATLQRQVDALRHKLAAKRGVAFLRDEHVRREFGNG